MTRRPAGDGSPMIAMDIWSPEPVFHEWGDYDTNRGMAIALCGRRIDPDHWRTTRMRRDHAQRIGRPCQPCLKKGMAWRYRFTSTHQIWSQA
jgi:hypothetical protein